MTKVHEQTTDSLLTGIEKYIKLIKYTDGTRKLVKIKISNLVILFTFNKTDFSTSFIYFVAY